MNPSLVALVSFGLLALALGPASAALGEEPIRRIYHAPPGDGVILRSEQGIPVHPHYPGERTVQGRYWSTRTEVLTSPHLSHRVTNATGSGYGLGGVYVEVDGRRRGVGHRGDRVRHRSRGHGRHGSAGRHGNAGRAGNYRSGLHAPAWSRHHGSRGTATVRRGVSGQRGGYTLRRSSRSVRGYGRR